jgi:capsid protein
MEHDAINREWQRMLVQRVLQRIYRVWVSKRMASVKDGGCGLLKFNPQAFDKYQWIGPASESVDPVGDASAQIELMDKKMLSKQRYFTQLGLNWQSELAQIKREEDWAKENGMAPVAEPPAVPAVDEAQPVKDKTDEFAKT